MLEQICAEIRNYFVREIRTGDFVIEGGKFRGMDFLQDGQHFRIVGSVFNDGVYQFPATKLVNEEFSGTIWAMAVPPAVIALAAEIEKWMADNKTALDSPYATESYGGYSYSKYGGGGYNGTGVSWQSHFAARLNPYRKV